eukprot:1161675-Pelagomonas_calceolata.AAC.9
MKGCRPRVQRRLPSLPDTTSGHGHQGNAHKGGASIIEDSVPILLMRHWDGHGTLGGRLLDLLEDVCIWCYLTEALTSCTRQ